MTVFQYLRRPPLLSSPATPVDSSIAWDWFSRSLCKGRLRPLALRMAALPCPACPASPTRSHRPQGQPPWPWQSPQRLRRRHKLGSANGLLQSSPQDTLQQQQQSNSSTAVLLSTPPVRQIQVVALPASLPTLPISWPADRKREKGGKQCFEYSSILHAHACPASMAPSRAVRNLEADPPMSVLDASPPVKPALLLLKPDACKLPNHHSALIVAASAGASASISRMARWLARPHPDSTAGPRP